MPVDQAQNQRSNLIRRRKPLAESGDVNNRFQRRAPDFAAPFLSNPAACEKIDAIDIAPVCL
jgi:hypothetical protein